MNVRINNLLTLVLILAIALVGCDRIEDDAFPVGDALFTPETDSRTITPGSSVIIDLTTAIQADQEVSFRTGEAPSRGRVRFYSSGLMEYEPDDTFSSGQDDFTVEMLNADSMVLDAEGFTIKMVGETADLPCFNGALGDYAWTAKNQSVIVLPLINDGFCESEIESFSFRTEQPEHGEVNLISPLEVAYVPDPDFIGLDYFFYTLRLTDKDGHEFTSTAKVEIEVSDQVRHFEECIEELLSISQEGYFYPTGEDDDLLLELGIASCLGEDVEVFIDYVLYGEAEVDGDLLLYFPNFSGDSIDVIGLKLVINQDTLSIDLPVIIGHDPYDCEYDAFPNPHLVLEDEELAEVYQIVIYDEDPLCAFLPWSIEIVEAQQGTAEIGDDGHSLLWYPGDESLDSLVLIHYNIVYEDGSFLERCVSIYREDFFKIHECLEYSFPSQYITVESISIFYEFPLYEENDECDIPAWDIEIVETIHTSAEVYIDENRIVLENDLGPNLDGYYGVIYEVVFTTGERLVREIIIEVDDSFHFECIEQFIHPETVYFGLDQLAQGEIVIFELSDQCELAIDSLEVIESELGAVNFDGGKVLFSPNDQFVDHAVVVLMVVLPETGDVFEKIIEIILEGDTFPGCAEAAFHDQHNTLDNKGQESYSMTVFFPPPGCPTPAWELAILEVSNGEADIAANGQDIVWYPNYDDFEEEARIVYVVTFEGGQQLERVIELQFVEDEDCFETTFPNQEIHLGTPANIQFEIQVAFTHTLCLFPAWELDITDVSFGSAEYNSETASIIYTLDSGQTDPVVIIAYNIVFDNGDFEPRELALIFDPTDPICALAHRNTRLQTPAHIWDLLDQRLRQVHVAQNH
ncbi:MAG: hypothetical protein RIC80_05565, partial [Cyclobacteriaceae bacterium]